MCGLVQNHSQSHTLCYSLCYCCCCCSRRFTFEKKLFDVENFRIKIMQWRVASRAKKNEKRATTSVHKIQTTTHEQIWTLNSGMKQFHKCQSNRRFVCCVSLYRLRSSAVQTKNQPQTSVFNHRLFIFHSFHTSFTHNRWKLLSFTSLFVIRPNDNSPIAVLH